MGWTTPLRADVENSRSQLQIETRGPLRRRVRPRGASRGTHRPARGRSAASEDRGAPKQGDAIITKHRVSAFAGTDLDVVFRANGIDATATCSSWPRRARAVRGRSRRSQNPCSSACTTSAHRSSLPSGNMRGPRHTARHHLPRRPRRPPSRPHPWGPRHRHPSRGCWKTPSCSSSLSHRSTRSCRLPPTTPSCSPIRNCRPSCRPQTRHRS
jgi:hypothetical protein